MSTVKGKCSICGGCVMEASPAYCSNCGAREAGPAERVIEMVPAQLPHWSQPVPFIQPYQQWWPRVGDVYCGDTHTTDRIEIHHDCLPLSGSNIRLVGGGVCC